MFFTEEYSHFLKYLALSRKLTLSSENEYTNESNKCTKESAFIVHQVSSIILYSISHGFLSDENLLVTLIDFFIAGTANTTSTLDFSFLLIANHQDVQRQLHEEIDNVIGRNRLPELNDRVK